MLTFHKFQGTGNDFIIFNEIDVEGLDYSAVAKSVCNRHLGIGADGMIVVSSSECADIRMVFYNADGTEATMCGNGIRCFSKFVYDNQLLQKQRFTVETLAGIMKVEVIESSSVVSQIRVNLGKPYFKAEAIPVTENEAYFNQELVIAGQTYNINTLVIGTIHTVIFVENMDEVDVAHLGKLIENHPIFPLKTNVNFCQMIDRSHLKVSTWEKGVGLTLACGTGVTASAIVSQLLHDCESRVNVEVAGGLLVIENIDEEYDMTGPATLICKGEYVF